MFVNKHTSSNISSSITMPKKSATDSRPLVVGDFLSPGSPVKGRGSRSSASQASPHVNSISPPSSSPSATFFFFPFAFAGGLALAGCEVLASCDDCALADLLAFARLAGGDLEGEVATIGVYRISQHTYVFRIYHKSKLVHIEPVCT